MTVLANNSSYALVGPGAVGLYYGGLLVQAGAELHVLARSDAAALQTAGITLRRVDSDNYQQVSEHRIEPAQVSTDPQQIGPVDCVIVAAKSTYNEKLIDDLRPLIVPGRTVILTLQNGVGNAEFFGRHFPASPILCGLCFVCVNRTAPAVVENYHPGRVEFGSLHSMPRSGVSSAGISPSMACPSQQAESPPTNCWPIPLSPPARAA
jgi:2-dehydropantoate 2-reductase